MFPSDEGINGYYYNPDLDIDGYYDEYPARSKNPFVKDSLFYHVPLFEPGEHAEVVAKTDKAILFRVSKGEFWVPKSLMVGRLVHISFKRKYIQKVTIALDGFKTRTL